MNRYLAMLIGGLLGGCAVGPGAPPAPAAGTEFDGQYLGQSTLTRGGGYLCGTPSSPASLVVRGGRFDYPFEVSPPRTASVPVQIAADGTFAGQMLYAAEDYWPVSKVRNAWVTVSGRITDGTLDATIVDYRCARQLTAQRS
jgi:hypothetical protein